MAASNPGMTVTKKSIEDAGLLMLGIFIFSFWLLLFIGAALNAICMPFPLPCFPLLCEEVK